MVSMISKYCYPTMYWGVKYRAYPSNYSYKLYFILNARFNRKY